MPSSIVFSYLAYYVFVPASRSLSLRAGRGLARESVPRSARGVYGISVASELSGIAPQTLRLYERWGLLAPSRTAGGTRRYSDDDLERLRRITELVDQGVNLAGIAQILDLQIRNSQLESDYTKLQLLHTKLVAEHKPDRNPQLRPSPTTAKRRSTDVDETAEPPLDAN